MDLREESLLYFLHPDDLPEELREILAGIDRPTLLLISQLCGIASLLVRIRDQQAIMQGRLATLIAALRGGK